MFLCFDVATLLLLYVLLFLLRPMQAVACGKGLNLVIFLHVVKIYSSVTIFKETGTACDKKIGPQRVFDMKHYFV